MPKIVFRGPTHTVTRSLFSGLRIINNATGTTRTPSNFTTKRLAANIKTVRRAGYDLKGDAAAISAMYMWLVAVTESHSLNEGVELSILDGDDFLAYFRAVYVSLSGAPPHL